MCALFEHPVSLDTNEFCDVCEVEYLFVVHFLSTEPMAGRCIFDFTSHHCVYIYLSLYILMCTCSWIMDWYTRRAKLTSYGLLWNCCGMHQFVECGRMYFSFGPRHGKSVYICHTFFGNKISNSGCNSCIPRPVLGVRLIPKQVCKQLLASSNNKSLLAENE